MKTYNSIYGIDVSKDTLDLVVLGSAKSCAQQIPNEEASIQEWVATLDQSESLCILEYTGTYSARILYHLCQNAIAVKVVTPAQSNGFVNAQGIISKNDRQAAHTLALMGHSLLDLPFYQAPNEMIQQRKQLVQALNALKKQRQMLNNQLHALAQLPLPLIPQGAKEAYEAVLSTAEEQIKLLEEQLDELGDEEYDQQLKRLCSVVGIGQRTARALILATGGLQRFKHSRQLSKFIGLVPATHRSGSSVFKKGRITKKGQPELRATLYMAAMSAKRFNMACKDLYERLRAKGKPHKQAMVAVMNKLVKQAYGVIVNNTDFDNEYYLKFQE